MESYTIKRYVILLNPPFTQASPYIGHSVILYKCFYHLFLVSGTTGEDHRGLVTPAMLIKLIKSAPSVSEKQQPFFVSPFSNH